ncbi:MAG: hypothetical protein ACYTGQ_03705 [Planctomycetota bacterium]
MMLESHQIRSGLRAGLGAVLGCRRLPNARQKAARLEASRRHSAGRCEARTLHAQASRALEGGALEEASAYIDAGLRLWPEHPGLLELGAVCDLRSGAPERAVSRLSGVWGGSGRREYLLALARYGSGDALGAHLGLIELDRHEDCPAPARVLLALLELDRHEPGLARAALRRNLAHGADDLTCQALVLTELAERLPEEASQAAGFLAHAFALDGFQARWLRSLGLANRADLPNAPSDLVRQMGATLLARQHVIPTLMLAQKHRPHRGRINQLRGALGLIVEELEDTEQGYRCLGELALLAGDPEDARRWVWAGLAEHAYSAGLALLSDRVDEALAPDREGVRVTIDALRLALEDKPGYSDLRRALILRYRRQGLDAQAMRHARQWVDQAPEHPLAKQTLKEVAA